MATEIRPQQPIVFVCREAGQPQGQQGAQMQQNGLQLIQSLQKRVRTTEAAFGALQIQSQGQLMQRDTQLFRVTRAREQAEGQVRALTQQQQQQQQSLRQMQQLQGQNQQLVQAQRGEIARLQGQVQHLGQQLQQSLQRVGELELQIQGMVAAAEQKAAEAKRERTEILNQLSQIKSKHTLVDHTLWFIRGVFLGTASLFIPSHELYLESVKPLE